MSLRRLLDWASRLARYNFIQVLAYLIDIGFFLAGTALLHLPPLPVNLIGKLLAGAFAFPMHKIFTFRSRGSSQKEGIRYFVVLGANIPLSAILFLLWSLILRQTPAKVASDVTGMLLTFLLVQHLVFRQRADPERAP